jgi:hypothetical protein
MATGPRRIQAATNTRVKARREGFIGCEYIARTSVVCQLLEIRERVMDSSVRPIPFGDSWRVAFATPHVEVTMTTALFFGPALGFIIPHEWPICRDSTSFDPIAPVRGFGLHVTPIPSTHASSFGSSPESSR